MSIILGKKIFRLSKYFTDAATKVHPKYNTVNKQYFDSTLPKCI